MKPVHCVENIAKKQLCLWYIYIYEDDTKYSSPITSSVLKKKKKKKIRTKKSNDVRFFNYFYI